MQEGTKFLLKLLCGAGCRLVPGTQLAPLRAFMWRCAGVQIDPTAVVYHDVKILAKSVAIGARTYVGPEVLIAGDKVTIGSQCDISARVLIHSGTHHLGPHERRAGALLSGEVIIENGVWVGCGSTILAGSLISAGSVIGAGALVRNRIQENSIAAGVPARHIRNLA